MTDKDSDRAGECRLGAVARGDFERKTETPSLITGLLDIQDQRAVLNELYEQQKSYGQRISEVMKTLQHEADAIIKIPPEVLGPPFTAAYLVSDAVVVTFDLYRNMTTRPLHSLPMDVIISVVEQCTPELRKLISEKKRSENSKLVSLEKVMKELEATHEAISRVGIGSRKEPVKETAPGIALHETDSDSPSELDEIIVNAVEKGLEVVGEDGKQTLLALLESRYGLRVQDIPQHCRGFVELLDELVGSGAHAIEQAILTELSKAGPVDGMSLYEAVRSLEGHPVSASGHARDPVPVEREDEVPSKSAEPEPSPSEPESHESNSNDATPSGYTRSFKLDAKPIPISQFLQS